MSAVLPAVSRRSIPFPKLQTQSSVTQAFALGGRGSHFSNTLLERQQMKTASVVPAKARHRT